MKIDGFKKAALKIYMLGSADRDWVLTQLPADDSRTLRALMAEIKSSGIKPVFLPFDEMVEAPLAINAAPAKITGLDAKTTLMALGLHDLERVVGDEPDWVVAALCNAHDWPWRSLVLQRMPPGRRVRLQGAAADPNTVKPRMLEAILNAAVEKHRAGPRHGGASTLRSRTARPGDKGS